MERNAVVERACSLVGGQSALADACGVSPQAVSQWIRGIRPVPIERCLPIERATNGAVTRRDLCPTDWMRIWPELAAAGEVGHA